ncbi:AAA family ATPase [bacterium]|nr:AAA family ATPase [bacterium]
MTKPLRIDRITAKCLRGATCENKVLLPDRKIILLFGENGTGKSTIVDAVDLVCCESFGSLAEISPQLKSHLPSLGAKHAEVEVSVSCGPQTWTARLKGKTGVTVTPSEGRPRVSVLRRCLVQRLVTATGSERFNTLKDDIDVGGLDSAEEELRKAVKKAKDSLTASDQAIASHDGRIAELFNQEKRPDEENLKPLAWLRARASVDTTAAKKEEEFLKTICDAFAATDSLTSEAKEGMTELTRKRGLEKTANEELRSFVQGNPEAARILNEILVQTLKYLEAEPRTETCPVCRQRVKPDELRAQIDERLKAQPDLQVRLKAAKDAEEQRKNEEILQKGRYQRLTINAAALLQGLASSLPASFLKEAERIAAKCPLLREWKADATYDKEARRAQIKEAEAVAEWFREAAATWSTRLAEIQRETGAIETKKTLLKTYEQTLRDGRQWEQVQSKLVAAHKIVAGARKQYVQRVLDRLADDCDRIYQAIHPGEQLCGIRFVLDQEKKGSLEQHADFKGFKDVIPQTCFSDSHLDTLSFSFFLAMARQGNSSETILVIDDIFTSEDDRHLRNIASLLANEAASFAQIIVTTHLRKWTEWVRSGRLPQSVYAVVELSSKWDMKSGITSQISQMDDTEIKDLLASMFLDRTALAAKTRRFLEGFVGPIVVALGGHAPMRRYGDYELSDFLCGLQSLTKGGWRVVPGNSTPGVLRAPSIHETYDVRAKAKEFNESKSVVNKLIHASEEGEHYTDDEAREFAQEVIELHRYFKCEKCGAMVGARRKTMACTCGEWKLAVHKTCASV